MTQNINLIIFGITGDLARNKLLPALSKLKKNLKVIGVGRRPITDLPVPYIKGEFDDKNLYSNFNNKEEKLFYLALPPDLYESVIKRLPVSKKDKILLEKPFGSSLATAKKLNKVLLKKFKESQIYRVDHYLGKESVQKIGRYKFDFKKTEKIEITILEKEGVKNRGIFYDKFGALYDVGQNHLLAILGLITKQKADILKLVGVEHGQYKGYLQELGVDPKSKTETYFKIVATWKGVKVVLESGKKMKESKNEVKIYFKNGKIQTFKIESGGYESVFLDAIKGNKKIFPTGSEIFSQWKFVEKVAKKLKQVPLRQYV